MYKWDICIKSMRIARHERKYNRNATEKNMNIVYIELVESHTKKC